MVFLLPAISESLLLSLILNHNSTKFWWLSLQYCHHASSIAI